MRRIELSRNGRALPRAKRILRAHLLPKNAIVSFCRHWKIREMAVFGSAIRQDFKANSDLDLLVTFAADAEWSLLDHVQMKQELEKLLERKIDLITKRALMRSPNWIIRKEILTTAKVVYSEEVVHAT